MYRETGLSLLELLISLVLLTLIGTMSYPSLSTVFSAWRASSVAASASDDYAGHRFLRQQLGRALPIYTLEQSSRTRLIAFDGGEEQVTFVSPLENFATIKRGLYASAFAIEEDKQDITQTLVFSYQIYRQGPFETFESRDPVPVLAGITAASFEYLGPRSKKWQREWKDEKTLPAAVRFSFTDREQIERRWTLPLTLAAPALPSYSEFSDAN